MAIVIEANYSKKLGLPGYSSHSYSVTLRSEIADLSQVERESSKLYSILQGSVDREIQETGFVPEPAVFARTNHGHANGGRSAGSTGALNLHLRFKAQDPRAGRNAKAHWIELGSSVNSKADTLVTYLFAIGEEENDSTCKGLRKVHFDLEPKNSKAEPKPAIHLQFAGRCPDILLSSGYAQDAFDYLLPGLDKPRIPSLPMCTALLLQWAFLEYQSSDDQIDKFIKTPEWQAVICAAERDILKTYFQKSHDWLASTANEKVSFLAYMYH
jgi:hypothetical protein